MFTWMWIFEIVLLCGARRLALAAEPNITTCEEFERGARFNPYLIIDSMWKIFYFWPQNVAIYPIIFGLPSNKRLLKFKETVEAIEPGMDVEWNKATLFMTPQPGTEVLFLYAGGNPGAFRAVIVKEQRQRKVRPFPIPQIKLADVRMSMKNSYLGMMCCEDLSIYVLARMDNIPRTDADCENVARKLGLLRPEGKTYLYLKRKIEDEL